MSVRANQFAQKEYNISSEEINLNVQDLTKLKANTHRVLTDLDIGGITLGNFGNTPDAKAATVDVGDILHFQPCDATHPGSIDLSNQTLGDGDKTIQGDIVTLKRLRLPTTSDSTHGVIEWESPTKKMRFHCYSGIPNLSENIFLGEDAGNFTSTTSYRNIGIGSNVMKDLTEGNHNICLSFYDKLTTGSNNTLIQGGSEITTGSHNVCIGYQMLPAGVMYTTESNNIAISSSGSVGDNNVIRIGEPAVHNECYLAGVYGSSIPGDVVVVDSNGRLGKTTATISGTNTGDVTLNPIGAVSNANGASLSGQILTLQPASNTFGGIVTTGTQNFAGAKTFVNTITTQENINLPETTSTAGNITIDGGSWLHNYSSNVSKSNVFLGRNAGNYSTSSTANCCVGNSNGAALTSGSSNTLLGWHAGQSITTGGGNLCLGSNAGTSLTTTGNNIMLDNSGTVGDTNKIYIGNSSHTGGATIFGINGKTSTGGIAVYVNASGVMGTTTSSKRFKNTINDITPEKSSKLHQLRVVDFFYNDDTDHLYPQNGLIAEEVEQVYPELICHESDGITPQTIYYHLLWPLLLKEIQILKTKIEEIETRLPN